MRTSNNSPGGDTLRSWVIEVSNDGTENSWVEIDRRDDSHDLNCCYVTVSSRFPVCQAKASDFCVLGRLDRTITEIMPPITSTSRRSRSLELFGRSKLKSCPKGFFLLLCASIAYSLARSIRFSGSENIKRFLMKSGASCPIKFYHLARHTSTRRMER